MKIGQLASTVTFCLTFLVPACSSQEPVSQTKYDEVVTSYDAPRYEFFLKVFEACLADTTQALCAENLSPSVMLPLRLGSAADSDKMKAGFTATPRVLVCDPVHKMACRLELDRVGSGDLVIKTDRREQLTKLTFTGPTVKIKVRLIKNADSSKTLELCKISGIKATKEVIFAGEVESNIIRGVFRYSSAGKLLGTSSKPIIVTVDTLGGTTTENCEF